MCFNYMDSYQVLSGYKLKEISVFPHCAMILLCVYILSPILDSSASMILLTDSCISRTCRGAEGEKKIGKAGGERGVRKRAKSG